MNKYQKLNEAIAILSQITRDSHRAWIWMPKKQQKQFNEDFDHLWDFSCDLITKLQQEIEILKMKSPSQHEGYRK